MKFAISTMSELRVAAAALTRRVEMDFLMPDRFAVYEDLLRTVCDLEYESLTIRDAWARIQNATLGERTFVLRNDVDTDPRTAAELWRVDQRYGITATYFFRLRTLDAELMRSMNRAGTEASYHYEEVATVAKRLGLRDRADVQAHLEEIQALFARNIARVRAETGLPITTVASHGDFANRKVKTPNHVLLADPDFRVRVGVALEAYDDLFMRQVTFRASDATTRTLFTPSDPRDALRAGSPFVYVLVHPRQWHVDRKGNAAENLLRVREGAKLRMSQTRRTRSSRV